MIVELDGRQMTDRAKIHDHLKTQLNLPEYYGRNLDALYDLLTEICQPTEIVLRDSAEMEAQMGRYAGALLSTLREAAENNPALKFRME